MIRRIVTTYGMLAVLILLCGYFSWSTYHQEKPTGREGGSSLAADIANRRPAPVTVAIVSTQDLDGVEFANALAEGLTKIGRIRSTRIVGDPPSVRQQLETMAQAGKPIDLIATTPGCRDWGVWDALKNSNPLYSKLEVISPTARGNSTFLGLSNLRNIADQIAVIAIIAVGMTMVIITGGIDLSVGSLVALSAVLTAYMIRLSGGVNASSGAMLLCSLAAIVACGLVGGFSGFMITTFRIPPFIATLAMMQVASGMAFIRSRGQTIYDIPASFTWLGRGSSLFSLPNAVVLMIMIYIIAHIVMKRTITGRNIYAVGGNLEAARLSGIITNRTLMFTYLVAGLVAGIGGVITVSQLKAGAPTYGNSYELFVIAAVVVGGTSLSGGEGRIFGTLVGAFIIAVIRNGMNLMNVEPYTQKVVLGLVILGAVLLDMLKQRRWKWLKD